MLKLNYIETDKCVECHEAPIDYMKWGVCKKCYYILTRPEPKRRRTDIFIPKFKKGTSLKTSLNCLKKYGVSFFDDLDLLESSHITTLNIIGAKYGLTRERIRQLFTIIKGYPYTESWRLLSEHRKLTVSDPCTHDPRRKVAEYKGNGSCKKGAIIEKQVLEKCQSLNYAVNPHCSVEYDLNINGYAVDVKSSWKSYKMSKNNKSHYFHFNLRKTQIEKCDFFICYAKPKDTFYIIPIQAVGGESIYIREEETHQHPCPAAYPMKQKWEKYREAWHFLKGGPDGPEVW